MYSPQLKQNGGTDIFGTSTECFRKGYGLGYNAPMGHVASFLAEWGGRYKPYINQKLYYGDGALPPRYQPATLAQSLSRGYALGRVAKAKSKVIGRSEEEDGDAVEQEGRGFFIRHSPHDTTPLSHP